MKINDPLAREDLIGRTITAIYQRFESEVGGLEHSTCYFLLDSAISFCLPGEWADGLSYEEVPRDAKEFDNHDVGNVLHQPIVALMRERRDSNLALDSLCLLLQNEWLIWDVAADYQGMGNAGLHVVPPGKLEVALLEPIWK